MKRLISAILVIVCILVLASCSSGREGNTTTPFLGTTEPTEEPIKETSGIVMTSEDIKEIEELVDAASKSAISDIEKAAEEKEKELYSSLSKAKTESEKSKIMQQITDHKNSVESDKNRARELIELLSDGCDDIVGMDKGSFECTELLDDIFEWIQELARLSNSFEEDNTETE